jgi:hypothetical protein
MEKFDVLPGLHVGSDHFLFHPALSAVTHQGEINSIIPMSKYLAQLAADFPRRDGGQLGG